ncbi:MAG: hypothetical protein D6733_05980 [Methanobacteriota archaeon]|nr:MAG: hypothetical protein D6733_05980 [Euryarchaeota archaeon]
MTFTEDILRALQDISGISKSGHDAGLSVGMAIIDDSDLDEVGRRIEAALEPHASHGEKMVSRLMDGEILDCGTGYFRIRGGYVVEFYEYEKGASVFIRSYLISDGTKEWIAVYVDENPRSLWWDRGERG